MHPQPVRRPEVTELEALLSAADEGSFAAAARSLHISTPAVAKRVHTLETLLGQALVETNARGIKLTELAEAVVPQIRSLLVDVDKLQARLADRRAAELRTTARNVKSILLDIPSAGRPDRALHDAERMLELLFDVTLEPLAVTRPSDDLVYVASTAFCELLGFERGELEGTLAGDIGPWRSETARAEIRRALTGGGLTEWLDPAMRRRDGTTFAGRVRVQAFRSADEPRLLTIVHAAEE